MKTAPWSSVALRTRVGIAALGALALAYVVTHIALAFTDRVNWDEFLLFQRAEVAITHGRLEGGGRPGLAVIALVPFVKACADPVSTIDTVRVVWSLWTLGLLAGVFVLVRRMSRTSASAVHGAALATACLALVPMFLHWSVQVRTDQPAVACALWGGVALLLSHDRPLRAVLAGLGIGVGYLFSQKALYVGALCALIAVADLYVERGLDLRREARRSAYALGGFLLVVGLYMLLVPLFYAPAATTSLDAGMNAFAYYRKLIGFRVYAANLPTLYPLLLLGAAMVAATVRAYVRRSEERHRLVVALAVVAAGVQLARFHAAAFPYFWITLGLFASVAIGVAWPAIVAMLGRASIAVACVAWAWLLYIAGPYARSLLSETQAPQRDTFDFIARNFPAAARGFHADGGLFCRSDPDPFPGFIRQNIQSRFTGPGSEPRVHDFVEQFRMRPVSFLVTNGLELFPPEVQAFWARHYVPYYGAAAIAGSNVLTGESSIDIIVPATYRWFGEDDLVLGARTIHPRDVLQLTAGTWPVRNTGTAEGSLVLAVKDAPHPAPREFHSIQQIAELLGNIRW